MISNPASLAETEIDDKKIGSDKDKHLESGYPVGVDHLDALTASDIPNLYDDLKFSGGDGTIDSSTQIMNTAKIDLASQQLNPNNETGDPKWSSTLKEVVLCEESTTKISVPKQHQPKLQTWRQKIKAILRIHY